MLEVTANVGGRTVRESGSVLGSPCKIGVNVIALVKLPGVAVAPRLGFAPTRGLI